MMRLLLHGPAKSASRKKLIELKAKYNPNAVIVFEEGADEEEIFTAFKFESLFEGERLAIIENPSFDSQSVQSTLPFNLIIWFDHEVDPKKWSGFQASFFPEAKEISVFPFLDFLADQNKNAFAELYKLKKAGFDTQYLLTMIFYLLRSLTMVPPKLPDFVRKKLARQKAGFGEEKIRKLYKEMLKIDFKIKAGLMEKDHAEFLLVQKFLD